jgi:hypothetical protein
MEMSFKNALEVQCTREQREREVAVAWINDSSLDMDLCDYCKNTCAMRKMCIGFEWNGKSLEKMK